MSHWLLEKSSLSNPLFLLFAVISWLVADDEALLSLSLKTCDLSKAALQNRPVSSRINNCDPHDVPQCTSGGYLQNGASCLEVKATDFIYKIPETTNICKGKSAKSMNNLKYVCEEHVLKGVSPSAGIF